MTTGSWKVFGNGPVTQLAENLLHVTGSLSFGTIKRTMTVAKKNDGSLVIHSAIAMPEAQMKELESFGTPAILIVPSGYHRLDARAYKERYPALRVFAPRGSRKKIEEALPVDATYDDFPNCESIRLETLPGVGEFEGAMFVTSADGLTLVLNDIVFNMDKKQDFAGWLFTTLMGNAPGPRVSRLSKLVIVKDKKRLRAELEKLANVPNLRRLVVAHEKVAIGADASDALRKAATFL